MVPYAIPQQPGQQEWPKFNFRSLLVGDNSHKTPPFEVFAYFQSSLIESNSSFAICTPIQFKADLDRLHNEMLIFYEKSSMGLYASRVHQGELYAAFIDGLWRRVRVEYESNIGRDSCLVVGVDDGVRRVINENKLYELDESFVTNPYGHSFGVYFVQGSGSLASDAGLTHPHELVTGELLRVFVLSDKEPFLALFAREADEIAPEKLIESLDAPSAKLCATREKCRGVAYGSYSAAVMNPDDWSDVCVVAYEDLQNIQVRGVEQSMRLIYLEEKMHNFYDNSQLCTRLNFESPLHLVEGLACVVWDAAGKRWLRARITKTSCDKTVVDAVAVDYPSLTLCGLKFQAGEVLMLRTDLLFPPLCYHVRAFNCNDKSELLTYSNIAKNVLMVGAHIKVFTNKSSTLSSIVLPTGLQLMDYISHTLQVEHLQHLNIANPNKENLSPGNMFNRSICCANELPPFSPLLAQAVHYYGSICNGGSPLRPPKMNASDHFSQSLSLGDMYRKQEWFNNGHLPSASFNQSSCLQLKRNSTNFSLNDQFNRKNRVTSFDEQRISRDDVFRKPMQPSRNRRNSFFGYGSANVESDFLNRTLTSGESDTESETFSKSTHQKRHLKLRTSLDRSSSSTPLQHSDSCSDYETKQVEVPVEVLSVNSVSEIFLSTPWTKRRAMRLKIMLASLKAFELKNISEEGLALNNEYLCWIRDSQPFRVRVLSNESGECKVFAIDSGQVRSVDKSADFYLVPDELTQEQYPATCIGPVRLAGAMDARWLNPSALVFLRGLCENTSKLTACFEQTPKTQTLKSEWNTNLEQFAFLSDRFNDCSVHLFDGSHCCINNLFKDFINKR